MFCFLFVLFSLTRPWSAKSSERSFLKLQKETKNNKKAKPVWRGRPIVSKQELSFCRCTELCLISQSKPFVVAVYLPLRKCHPVAIRKQRPPWTRAFLQAPSFIAPQQILLGFFLCSASLTPTGCSHFSLLKASDESLICLNSKCCAFVSLSTASSRLTTPMEK